MNILFHISVDAPQPETIENGQAPGDGHATRNDYRIERGGRRGKTYYNPYNNWSYWNRENYQKNVDIDIKNLKTVSTKLKIFCISSLYNNIMYSP